MATKAATPARILIVDDHEDNVEVIRARLEAGGYQIESAADGVEALERVRQSPPDLILLDMHLPDMGGLEVVRALNTQISEGLYRVILLTGDSFSIDIVKAMSLGAHEYWLKPLKFETLRNDLPRVVRAARGDRQRSRTR